MITPKFGMLLLGAFFFSSIISCSKSKDDFNQANPDADNSQNLLSVTVSESGKSLTYTNIYDNNGLINAIIGSESDNASINYNGQNFNSITNSGNTIRKGSLGLSDLNGSFGDIIKTFVKNRTIVNRDANSNPTEISYYDQDENENVTTKLTYDTKHPFVFYNMILKNYGLDSLLSNYKFALFSTSSAAINLLPVNNITDMVITSQKRGILYIAQLTYNYNEETKYPNNATMTRTNYDYTATHPNYSPDKDVSIFSFKYK